MAILNSVILTSRKSMNEIIRVTELLYTMYSRMNSPILTFA